MQYQADKNDNISQQIYLATESMKNFRWNKM